MSGSRSRLRSSLVNAEVVEAATLSPVPASSSRYGILLREHERVSPDRAGGQCSAERLPASHQVLVLVGLESRVRVRWQLVGQQRIGDRELEAIAEHLQLGLAHLLHLVGGVAGLEARAERPSLDGVGQDHRRRAAMVERLPVGGVDLAWVVAAAAQPAQVIVVEVLDQRGEPFVRAEEVSADVRRRTRRGTSGTLRRGWRSSWRRGRRRCRRRATRPTPGPRRP